MAADDFEPKLGRIREPKRPAQSPHDEAHPRAGRQEPAPAWCGSAATSRPATRRRGMAPGVLARAGLIAPGSRRVIVRARYFRQRAGDLGAARAHLRYIQRDGITRDGEPGRLYDAHSDDADGGAFLDRSEDDPHQFRFIVSAEDSAAPARPQAVRPRSHAADGAGPRHQARLGGRRSFQHRPPAHPHRHPRPRRSGPRPRHGARLHRPWRARPGPEPSSPSSSGPRASWSDCRS